MGNFWSVDDISNSDYNAPFLQFVEHTLNGLIDNCRMSEFLDIKVLFLQPEKYSKAIWYAQDQSHILMAKTYCDGVSIGELIYILIMQQFQILSISEMSYFLCYRIFVSLHLMWHKKWVPGLNVL